jgi:hypothetical protein
MYEQSAAPVDPACSAHFDEIIARAGGLAGTPVKPAASSSAAADAAPGPVPGNGAASNQWRRLKIGEAAGEVAFRSTGTEAVVYFARRPVMKCVSGRDASDVQTLRALVERSSAALSPTSPLGDLVAVYCVDEDWGLRNMHLLDLRNHGVRVPKPFDLVALLSEWISFSPDGRYALLNQSGDEGNYTSLLLDLRTGVASVLGVPLFSDPLTWLTPRTVKYRANDVCEEPEKCETRSSYEYEVDILTKSVKSTKLGTSGAQQAAVALVVNGKTLSANQEKWIRFIGAQVLSVLPGSRAEQNRIAAVASWWSLKEGILSLSAPISYSSCSQVQADGSKKDVRLEPLQSCDAGRPWQVGLGAVQVPNFTDDQVASVSAQLWSGRAADQILIEAAKLAGYPDGSAPSTGILASQGTLRRSWLLRHPAIGVTLVERDATRECVVGKARWCYGTTWPESKDFAPDKPGALKSIADLEQFYSRLTP